MIWCDQSGLALFKGIFVVAVEQNHPMVIDMEVIAAVDGVVQDFCASVAELKQSQRWPSSAVVGALMLTVLLVGLTGSHWTGAVAIAAGIASMYSVWGSLPPVDPRNFKVGSDLWVQYREREHVRLMWMSATVRVFEMRLLRILERERRSARLAERRRRELQAPPPRLLGECSDGPVRQEETPAKSKTLGLRRQLRQRRQQAPKPALTKSGGPTSSLPVASCSANVDADASCSTNAGRSGCPSPSGDASCSSATDMGAVGPTSSVSADVNVNGEVSPGATEPPEGQAAEEASQSRVSNATMTETPVVSPDGEPLNVSDVWANPSAVVASAPSRGQGAGEGGSDCPSAQDCDEELEDDLCEEGDEIDAEFARRVQEHFRNRQQAAGKDLHSQTDRGNLILKSLCERLKSELERAVPAQ